VAVSIVAGTLLMSIPMLIALIVIAVLALLIAAFVKYTGEIVGAAYGMGAALSAIFTNIGLAFQNILKTMEYLFWKWVDSIIQKFKPFIEMINAVLSAMDKKTINVDFAADKASALSDEIGFVSVGDAWDTGYAKGYAKGEAIQSGINSWGDKLKGLGNGLEFGNMDGLLNFGANTGLGSNYNSPSKALDLLNDPASGLGSGGSFDPAKALKGIKGDTGNIADSMDLTEEDLQYLRDVANMEWKREYTTANITLDVTNNNNVNSDLDVFGIAHKLTEVLYEEADYLPNGVY
jgi:hypothetical protein